MGPAMLLAVHIATALTVAGYVHRHGSSARPQPVLFTRADRVLLFLTALTIGLAWPLFVPGLLVVGYRAVARRVAQSSGLRIPVPGSVSVR